MKYVRELWLVAAVIAVTIGAYAANVMAIPRGELLDPDCYMWLVSAERLHEGAGWYDHTIPRSNAPYGERLHWARPFDVLLIVPAWFLSLFTGNFSSALFAWSVLLSPVLMLAAAVALLAAYRALLRGEDLRLMGVQIAVTPGIILAFSVARPDHQSLILLLIAVMLWLGVRLWRAPTLGDTVALGFVAALNIWVSVESVVPGILILVPPAMGWILGFPFPVGSSPGESGASRDTILDARRWLRLGASLATSLAAGLFLAELLHVPPRDILSHFEIDSLSSLHVGVFALLAAVWWAMALWPARWSDRMETRAGVMAMGAFLTLALAKLLLPAIFLDPYSVVDPKVLRVWMSGIAEVEPLYRQAVTDPGLVLIYVGAAIGGLYEALRLSWRGWQSRDPSAPAWWFVSALIAVLLVASLFHNRWMEHASLVAVGPWCALVCRLIPRRVSMRNLALVFGAQIPVLIGLVFLVAAGFDDKSKAVAQSVPTSDAAAAKDVIQVANQGATPSSGARPTAHSWTRAELHFPQFCSWLNEQPGVERIVLHIHLGPEVLYRTRHEVLATPYHRNTGGILGAFEIMTSLSDQDALARVRARGVTMIVIAPDYQEEIDYDNQVAGETLYHRLLEGGSAIPSWLHPIELPGNLGLLYRVFRVQAPTQ